MYIYGRRKSSKFNAITRAQLVIFNEFTKLIYFFLLIILSTNSVLIQDSLIWFIAFNQT